MAHYSIEQLDDLSIPPLRRFHTASIAPSPIQPFVHSQSTSGSNVVVFGFPRDKYEEIVGVFVAMGDSSVIESPVACNWVTISYKNSWEAARAIRRNGEIIGGTTMIGVKWAVGVLRWIMHACSDGKILGSIAKRGCSGSNQPTVRRGIIQYWQARNICFIRVCIQTARHRWTRTRGDMGGSGWIKWQTRSGWCCIKVDRYCFWVVVWW